MAKTIKMGMTLSHPGKMVLDVCLKPLELSVAKGAAALGVSRQAIYKLVRGEVGISPEMAVRLSQAFGSSPEVWLGTQMDYDLQQIERRKKPIKVKRVKMPPHLQASAE
jgi:addiction module HigA family antidote